MLYPSLLVLSILNQALAYTCLPVIDSNLSSFTLIAIDILTDAPDSTIVYLTYNQGTNYYTSSSASNGKAVFKLYLITDGLWDLTYSCGGSPSSKTIEVTKLSAVSDFPISPVDTGVSYEINFNIDLTGRTLASELLCKLSVIDNSGNSLASQVSGSGFLSTVINGKCSYNLQFLSVQTYNLLVNISESCTELHVLSASPTVYITNPITSMSITTTNNILIAYTRTAYKVSIFKGNSVLFTDECLVQYNLNNGTFILAQKSSIAPQGVLDFDILTAAPMSIFLSVTATSQLIPTNTFSRTIPLEIHALYFSISALTGANTDPTTSDEEFSISIKTVDQNNNIIENILDSVVVTLSLTALSAGNSGLMIYDGIKTYSNGTFIRYFQKATGTLTGIKIFSSGIFKLEVSSDPSPKIIAASKILNIKNFIISATQVEDNSIYRYKFFTLNLTLVGSDGNLFLGTRTIVLSGSSDLITGGGSADSSNGYVSWANVSVIVGGPDNPLIISKDPGDTYTGAIVITANLGKLNLSFDQAIPTTSDPFNVKVMYKDQSDTAITNHSPILVTLQLLDAHTGSLVSILVPPVNLTNGELSLSDLRILSSGAFKLRVESVNLMLGHVSEIVNIENKAIGIELVHSGIPTASNYFKMDLTYSLIGEDRNPYLLNCTIDLIDSESSLIGNTNFTQVPVNGIFRIPDVSFSTAGMKNITATLRGSNVTVTHQVNITPSILVGSFITEIPSTSSDLFSFIIRAKDAEQKLDELYYNPHLVTLSLESLGDPGTFEGLPSLSTSKSGVAEFLNYKIFSAGRFKIKVSAPNLDSWYSPLISIQLVSANLRYSANQLKQARNSLFLFNVTVHELHGAPYLYSIILSLTCSNATDVFFTSQAILTQNSTAPFYLSFLSEGLKFCKVTSSNSTSTSLTFNVSPDPINLDAKCFIGLTNETCYKCIPQASLLNGACSCVAFSSFNNITNTCDCDIGLAVYNDICTTCGNYFSSDELTSYFSTDYRSIIIKFARPVRQTLSGDCKGALIMPESLMNLISDCYLPSLYTMQVDFKRILPALETIISLDPLMIQAIGPQCTFDIFKLTVMVRVIYGLPTPISSIVGPSKISIICKTDGLTLTSKFILPEYNYNWTIFPQLSQDASDKTSHTLYLGSKSLVEGNFTFELVVTNSFYNTTAGSKLEVEITGQEAISLVITSGTAINVRAYDSLVLKASIISTCNSAALPKYSWSYSSSPVDKAFDFDTVTNQQQQKISLSINGGSLKPKIKYTFTVRVMLGKYAESASIDVDVVSSDLIIKLSRSSGTVGTQADFVTSYHVFDPDGECHAGDIFSVWSCSENGDQCLGSDNSLLRLLPNATELVVKKNQLRNKAFYTFNITASCQLKVNKVTTCIDIYIDKDKLGDIRIKSILDPIVSAEGITVIPSVTALEDPNFSWEIDPAIDKNFDSSQPILFIPPNTLTQGNTYRISLSMFSGSKDNAVSAYTYLAVKPEPICDKLEITSGDKGKLRFHAVGCQNAGPLNVLSFNFGYLKHSEIIWLTKPTLSNPIELLISNQALTGIVRVCNSVNSCRTYNASIPKTKGRKLEMDESDYVAETYDPEYIPSAIIYYSDLVTSDDELNYLYTSYSDFYKKEDLIDFYLDTLLDSTISLLNNTYSLKMKPSSILQGSTDTLMHILKNYSKYITNDQCSKLFNILTINSDVREAGQVLQTLNLLSSANMNLKPLNYSVQYSTKNITVFAIRSPGSSLINKTIKINNESIIMSNIGSSDTAVYDFQYTKYSNHDHSFSVSFNQDGTYINYNYNPYYTTESVNTSADTSVISEIEGPFDDSVDYSCLTYDGYNWENKGCSIISVNLTLAVVELDYFTSCRIIETDNTCVTGLGPILNLVILLVLCMILGVFTRKKDREVFDWPSNNGLRMLYPLTSVFIPQPRYRRSFIVFQLVSGQLLIITLIGVFQYYIDPVERKNNHRIYEYPIEQLLSGVAGWLVAQSANLPVFFGNVKFIKDGKSHLITLPAMIIITILCSLGVCLLTWRYCSGWSNYWILSYWIFMFCDLGIQLVYAALINMRLKDMSNKDTKSNMQIEQCKEMTLSYIDYSKNEIIRGSDLEESKYN